MIYFGTDGIRRRGDFFTTEFLEKVADATSALPDCSFVAVGRDTRTSGFFIEKTLASALRNRSFAVPCFMHERIRVRLRNNDYGEP